MVDEARVAYLLHQMEHVERELKKTEAKVQRLQLEYMERRRQWLRAKFDNENEGQESP